MGEVHYPTVQSGAADLAAAYWSRLPDASILEVDARVAAMLEFFAECVRDGQMLAVVDPGTQVVQGKGTITIFSFGAGEAGGDSQT